MDVTAQEVLHRLNEEELQVQSAGVGQGHHEAGQVTAGASHHHRAKVSPIHLPLLGGKRVQAEEWFAALRTQAGYGAAQLDDAAGVAAIMHHLIDPGGEQSGMLVQSLTNERQIWIYQRGPLRVFTAEALRFDGVAHCVGMDAQFACDGADLPVLGVVVTTNLYSGFRTDHQQASPSSWDAWKGINETPCSPTDPATQT